jgi:hypothetical protein
VKLQLMDFQPYGLTVMQSWEQIGLYLRAIDKGGVRLFVEIGYCIGGLQAFIVPICGYRPGFQYLGVEYDERFLAIQRRVHMKHPNAVYFEGDCWGEKFADTLRKALADIPNDRALLLCDGGNKPRELAYFKDFLRPGDLMMVHDYADEVMDADLECLAANWTEIEPERYRAALLPLFQRSI